MYEETRRKDRGMGSWSVVGTAVLLFLAVAGMAGPQTVTPELYQNLAYRYIGPPGNRAAAVVGVPGDPLTYYVGASSGGVFKSSDGGTTWEPVFDDQPAQSIGALAVAWSDPNVVWAGTGEAFVRSNISIGNGVYKSTDAGRTWTHMGLEKSGRIGRVAIDPRDPDIVFVAAMGHCYGPQKERGVYRTRDGGKTWEQVLFADENTGCFEIAMDMMNPRTLFAGMWPLIIRTWGRESGGPNGGIWKSTDGGDTWRRLSGHGLPEPPVGKVGLAISYSHPEIVYALIETGSPNRGVLWRSEDGGENWRITSYNRLLNERPHYASRIMVNPGDENEVYFAANSISRTLDGGYDADVVDWSGDVHDLWADPKDPDRLMLSDDAGGAITLNRGRTWQRIELPIAQMYHVAVDNQVPYYVYGGMQDGFAHKGASSGGFGGWWGSSATSEWQSTAGGECGFVVPDPVDPNIVWGGSYNADLQRADYRTGHIATVKVWPESIYGAHAAAVKYRFQWTFPIAISPHDHNTVYVGSQFVHRTSDGGRTWDIISPDLTTNDPKLQGPSGGLTLDNLAVEYGCVVFAISESPLEKGCIWAGTNDGLVQVTRDGGQTWANVTRNIPNLPPLGTISNVEPSRFEAGTCYITVDFHQVNNRDPYVYKTADYGKTWTFLGGGIPKTVFSYCHWVHEDPVRKGMLYLGTENSIYVSFNDGRNWLSIQNNLPHAPVHHMVVQPHFNDLVVGTYGRGFWIMDDVTPLQQLTDDVLKSEAHLFKPRPAYRLHDVAGGAPGQARATINYFLKSVPEGSANIVIFDEEGREVTRMTGPAKPGINRLTWNLRYPGARVARLRTRPPGNPHVVEEARFHLQWEREGWYPVQSWGTDAGFRGFLAAPGTYTVKLSVGGREFTQKLEVRKDPRSAGTVDDIRAQTAMQLAIREDLNAASDMISRIEDMKKQLFDIRDAADGKDEGLAEAIAELGKKMQAVEDGLFQPTIAEGDTKSFRDPQKVYEKLSVLAGDLSDSVDFAPNRQQREVFARLKEHLAVQKELFKALVKTDVAAFNRLLAEKGRAGIVGPEAEKPSPLLLDKSLTAVVSNLENAIPELMKKARIPGLQIALVRDGKVAWQRGYGIKNASTQVPVTEETIFEAASLTKPFFAYAVMRLVDEGLVDLDKPLHTFFTREEIEKSLGHSLDAEGFKREWFEKITARHVLSHTAGTPHGEGGKVLPLFFEPGTQWKYSAEGYEMLQVTIEKLKGEKLAAIMQRYVLDPLGMKRSSMIWRPEYEKMMANGHNIFSAPQEFRKRAEAHAAASLYTTAGEYARFVSAVLNGEGLKPETHKEMLASVMTMKEDPNLGWSLGFGLQNDANGTAFWQWGDYGIFRDYIIAYPGQRTAVVYLTNSFNGLSVCSELVGRSVGGQALGNSHLGYRPYDSAFFALLWAVNDGGPEKARSLLPELKKKNPEALSWEDIGFVASLFRDENRFPEARVVFEFIVQENPSSGRAAYDLAQTCLLQGDLKKAKAYYLKAQEATEDKIEPKTIAWDMDYLRAAESPAVLDEASLQKIAGDYEVRHITIKDGKLYYFREGGATAAPRPLLAFSRDTFFIEGVTYFRFTVEFDPQGHPVKLVGFYNDGRRDESQRSR